MMRSKPNRIGYLMGRYVVGPLLLVLVIGLLLAAIVGVATLIAGGLQGLS